MRRIRLDAIPGARSVRRIRRTIQAEIAENKSRLDHLGQDTAVLLEALTTIRSETASLAFALEDTKSRIADTGGVGNELSVEGRLTRLEETLRKVGEQMLAAVESHDQQSFSRLSAIRRELVSLGQSWDWSEDRTPGQSRTLNNFLCYLAPLLDTGTAIEIAAADVSFAAALRARGMQVVTVDAAELRAGTPMSIDDLQREQGWEGKVGLVRLPAGPGLTEPLGDPTAVQPEVMILEFRADHAPGADLENALEATAALGLRRWIALIRRPEGISFTVNDVSLPSSSAATLVFLRDRDTFMAAADWCSRSVPRGPLSQ
jgi:hypothetical protein